MKIRILWILCCLALLTGCFSGEASTGQSQSAMASTQVSTTPYTEPEPTQTQPIQTLPTVTLPVETLPPQTEPTEPKPTQGPTTQPVQTFPQMVEYTVQVRSAAGMPMTDVYVWVYRDGSLTSIAGSGRTDQRGIATITMLESSDYAIFLGKVPEGYQLERSYRFADCKADIVLHSAPIAGKDLSTADFQVGDIMYDFTVIDTDGNVHTLSQILQEKKVVVLNLFYINCIPCKMEMPYLQEAYEVWQEDVELLALDPVFYDYEPELAAYKEENGLGFPVVKVPEDWESLVKQGYPTTYVIDRYGVITLISVGSEPSAEPFLRAMEYYASDDYVQKLCHNGWSDLEK